MREFISRSANTLGMSLLSALAVTAMLQVKEPATAYAAANQTTTTGRQACEEAGYMWSTLQQKCANKWCSANGRRYAPGASRMSSPILGMRRVIYWCDGLTGQWGTIR